MNKFWFAVAQIAIRALVGSSAYRAIKDAVFVNEAADFKTGIEKRMDVAHEIRELGYSMAPALLNLAIETAVNAVKSR
ncbi:MAG: hypothetical protein QG599_1943 [Pseudomonadota bacterium]|nr:hypothetical protein [Pseudomonadota bacterium]